MPLTTPNLTELLRFVFVYYTILLIISAVYSILTLCAHWQNLRDNRGIDRLTWLFAICLPFGFVFYWALHNRDNGSSDTSPSGNTNYTPPPETPQGVAAAIAADLERERKNRR